MKVFLIALLIVGLLGCSKAPQPDPTDVINPLKNTNRTVSVARTMAASLQVPFQLMVTSTLSWSFQGYEGFPRHVGFSVERTYDLNSTNWLQIMDTTNNSVKVVESNSWVFYRVGAHYE